MESEFDCTYVSTAPSKPKKKKEKSKSETLQIRVAPGEKRKLESYAESQGSNISEVIRKYISKLPNRGGKAYAG